MPALRTLETGSLGVYTPRAPSVRQNRRLDGGASTTNGVPREAIFPPHRAGRAGNRLRYVNYFDAALSVGCAVEQQFSGGFDARDTHAPTRRRRCRTWGSCCGGGLNEELGPGLGFTNPVRGGDNLV